MRSMLGRAARSIPYINGLRLRIGENGVITTAVKISAYTLRRGPSSASVSIPR